MIEDNGNISRPANSDILNAPWGEGVVLRGDYADLVEDNTIRGNPTFGVLVLERPDPFPPTAKTVYFQSVAATEVSDNSVTRQRGTAAGDADIGLEGGVFGTMNSVEQLLLGQHVRDLDARRTSRGRGDARTRHAQRRRRDLFTEISR